MGFGRAVLGGEAMSACDKHSKNPVVGYHSCPGCEVEYLRNQISNNKDLEAAIERYAQRIYETWSAKSGYVPWVKGGNSLMQDKARRIAIYGEES